MSSSAPPSPALPIPKGPHKPSVSDLVAQLDNVHLEHPRQAGFVGGFTVPESKPSHGRNYGEKPLPPTPSGLWNSIPSILRPGHGRNQATSRAKRDGHQSSQDVLPVMQLPVPLLNMPSPDQSQSLTMAYARSAPPSLSSPFLDDPRPSYLRHQSNSSAPSAGPSSPPATPNAVARVRPSSTPASPSSVSSSTSAGQNSLIQCHGITKAGKRCTRVVKAPPLVSYFAPTSSEPVERFCFQHVKEVLSQSGFYSHKEGGGWVEFTGS